MSRRIIPIVIAVVAVIAFLNKGERPQDEHKPDTVVIDDSNEPKKSEKSRRKTSTTQFALDVERANWPPLADGSNDAAGDIKLDTLNTTNYYIVLDGSGSMLSKKCGGGSTKIAAAVDAVKHFFSTVPADANIGLAAFDRREISERVPLGVGNRDALNGALEAIRAGSDTPLRSSIKIGYDMLTAQARRQLGYGEYHLVVVTDGEPEPRSEDPTPVVKEILAQSPVVLHTIGFCIDSDHVLNQPKKTFYASATDPEELEKGLQAVLAESTTFDAVKFSDASKR